MVGRLADLGTVWFPDIQGLGTFREHSIPHDQPVPVRQSAAVLVIVQGANRLDEPLLGLGGIHLRNAALDLLGRTSSAVGCGLLFHDSRSRHRLCIGVVHNLVLPVYGYRRPLHAITGGMLAKILVGPINSCRCCTRNRRYRIRTFHDCR